MISASFTSGNHLIGYLEKAMRISPRHLDRGVHFGKTLIKMGKNKKAIQVFEKTLELSGSNAILWEEIADFCIDNNENEFAIKLLEFIINEQPKRADLLFKLSQVLERIDEIKRAILYQTRASEIDKTNVEIRIHIAQNYLYLKKPILAEKPLREITELHPENQIAHELLKQCV